MSNGYGTLIENMILRSIDTTLGSYVATYLQPWADLKASATRGGAIDGMQFKEVQFNGINYTILYDEDGDCCVPKYDSQGILKSIEKISLPFDKSFEQLGGLDIITGGPYGWEHGDATKRAAAIEDRGYMRHIAIEIAKDYYRPKAMNAQPTVIGGKNYYPVKIPASDSPLDYLDFQSYDLGLAAKYYGVGIAYDLVDPFFEIPKDVLLGATKRMQKTIKGAHMSIDPIVYTQLDLAKKISDSTGNLLLFLFPFMWLLRPYANVVRDEFVNTATCFADDLMGGFEGLIWGYNHQAAKARTHFNLPSGFELTDGGVCAPAGTVMKSGKPKIINFSEFRKQLSDAGPVDDNTICIDSREAEQIRMVA